MSQIILASHNGGLGDALIYSTLPERWAREGHEVYITGTWRNPGIPALVWEKNPFVKGITNLPPNRMIEIGPRLNKLLIQHGNNIMAHEAFFGLEPKNRYPRIYWTPGFDPRFRDKVVIDPGGITMPFTKEAFEEWLIWLRHWGAFTTEDMIVLDSGKVNLSTEIFPDIQRYKTQDIFEYATIIHSSRIFATNESGGAALASAIKGENPFPEVWAVISTRSHNTLTWKWDNIRYWTTGKMTPDF